jgi:hypothetical protein
MPTVEGLDRPPRWLESESTETLESRIVLVKSMRVSRRRGAGLP